MSNKIKNVQKSTHIICTIFAHTSARSQTKQFTNKSMLLQRVVGTTRMSVLVSVNIVIRHKQIHVAQYSYKLYLPTAVLLTLIEAFYH